MARTIIDELVTVVEFESDTKGLDKASRSISSFKTGALAALAAQHDSSHGPVGPRQAGQPHHSRRQPTGPAMRRGE